MLLSSLLSACDPSADDIKSSRLGSDAGDSNLDSETYTATTDRDGYIHIPVEIEAGGSFQVVTRRLGGGILSTDYVYNPDGDVQFDWEDWQDSDESLTWCWAPSTWATTVNWPVRASDGPLAAGEWDVAVATIDHDYYYQSGIDVEVEVLRRAAVGTALHAVIAYADGLEGDDEVVRGVEAATDYWITLYASYGITLTLDTTTLAVDAEMPGAWRGQTEIATLLEEQDERAVLVLIGETIAGDEYTYGEAANIPGPYAPTEVSVVEVAWLANAGADATFSADEISLMGETMAHEVGHYLGLFHPVEDGYASWDALDDTEACGSWETCDERLGDNLMYPYPICNGRGCTRQDVLSDDQIGVARGYVGVQ